MSVKQCADAIRDQLDAENEKMGFPSRPSSGMAKLTCRFCGFTDMRYIGLGESLNSDCVKCREEFALKAPFPLNIVTDNEDRIGRIITRNAVRRYQWADAMMEARNKKPSSDQAGTE